MPVSAFDLFRVGIGPSSSHTAGPMRAGALISERLRDLPAASIVVTLHGSLALTATGHGSDRAVVAGLLGHAPELIDPGAFAVLDPRPPRVRLASGSVAYALRLERRGPPGHPNAMRFVAHGPDGLVALDTTFRSIGGGFITEDGAPPEAATSFPLPYASAAELLAHAAEAGSIARVAAVNEQHLRSDYRSGLGDIALTMEDSIDRGLRSEGELPGGLRVRRRAPVLHASLRSSGPGTVDAIEWIALWAMAVNEENAAGSRVVTAPTNGACGVLPAVLRYARVYEGADDDAIVSALLAAAAVGALIKRNASISGAEVGCQGEVGSASAMAAAGLAQLLGGTPEQVANAAEIALEHHLGLTCDPVAGLVQIPCIERNALGATKALAAAKLALRGDGHHIVSLDHVIDAMRRTGDDMHADYKETSRGGLAVGIPEC